jgi:hypothetical protein
MAILNRMMMNWEDHHIPEDYVADFFIMQEEVPIMEFNIFVTVLFPQN